MFLYVFWQNWLQANKKSTNRASQQSKTVIKIMKNFILTFPCSKFPMGYNNHYQFTFFSPPLSLPILEIKENSIEIAFKNSLLEINSFYILKYNPTVNTIQHIKMQYNAMPYNIIRHNAASTRTPIQTGSCVCIKYSLHRTRVLGKLTLSSRKCLNIVFFYLSFI